MNKLKTRRGVFINLEDSDITLEYDGKLYKFSSIKKRDIYIKRVNEAIANLNKLKGKLYRLSGVNGEKDFDLNRLIPNIYDNIYKNMLYK